MIACKPKKNNKRRMLRRLLLAVLSATLLFFLAQRRLTPVILSMAQARSVSLATQALNDAVAEAMDGGFSYADLMDVILNNEGNVSLVKANAMQMNRLANSVIDKAQRNLNQIESQQLKIPLGSAFGISLFEGSGPLIPVRIVPVGSVNTEFSTEFESSGINQTRHKIFLRARASVQIVIPTDAQVETVTVDVLVAESIIVGEVPGSFVGYNPDGDLLNLVP